MIGDKSYYLYVFLDPRKPGKYQYGPYEFEYEPFYVGKGKLRRIKDHYKPSVLKDGTMKSNKFQKILNEAKIPIGIKLCENLTDEESKIKEIELIKLIGRIKLNNGSLTNLTDGGDGSVGFKHTEESRVKINKRYYPKGEKASSWKGGKPKCKECGKIMYYYSARCSECNKKWQVGENNPFYGKKHTKETFDKMVKYSWNFISPDQIEYKNISNLKNFCENYHLNIFSIYSCVRKNNKGICQGWQIEKVRK
jgi:hypothetical protein